MERTSQPVCLLTSVATLRRRFVRFVNFPASVLTVKSFAV